MTINRRTKKWMMIWTLSYEICVCETRNQITTMKRTKFKRHPNINRFDGLILCSRYRSSWFSSSFRFKYFRFFYMSSIHRLCFLLMLLWFFFHLNKQNDRYWNLERTLSNNELVLGASIFFCCLLLPLRLLLNLLPLAFNWISFVAKKDPKWHKRHHFLSIISSFKLPVFFFQPHPVRCFLFEINTFFI